MKTPDTSDTASAGFHIPGSRNVHRALHSLSFIEKVFVYMLFGILIVSTLFIVWDIQKQALTEVPLREGSLTEGIVGSPRFVNPLLATSPADKDLTELIYSGLMKHGPQRTLIPNLAKNYTISENGLTYTFTLKENVYFHDGERVTADDVLFTITKAQDPLLKSPVQPMWEGISIEKIDTYTVSFTLPSPYAPFLENTTLGILPEHIWKTIPTDQFELGDSNTHPIGSGPYTIHKVERNTSGIPHTYKLRAFEGYALGEPFIGDIILKFYPDIESLLSALKEKQIQSMSGFSFSLLDEIRREEHALHTYQLPRIFGVFFNQNRSGVLGQTAVREALRESIDTTFLVENVLQGFGTPLRSVLPPYLRDAAYIDPNTIPLEDARTILDNAGFSFNETTGLYEEDDIPLTFTLSTSDTPELKASAEYIQSIWRELGIDVMLEIFPISELHQEVIRPRQYDALLFGQIVGRTGDLFPFWHSSQRNDPGLNIALYANISVDALLERLRTTRENKEREDILADVEAEMATDIPALFLFTPDFLYLTPKDISGITLDIINEPYERFADIHTWYRETEDIWSFTHN